MASARDTLIQHNGFGGQAIYEEPGPLCKQMSSRTPGSVACASRACRLTGVAAFASPGKPERIVRIDDWVGASCHTLLLPLHTSVQV